MPVRKSIGQAIAELREKRGIERRRLARMAGLDAASLLRIENGRRKDVPLAVAFRLCRAMELSLDDLAAYLGWTTPRSLPSVATPRKLARIDAIRHKLRSVVDELDKTVTD